MGNTKAKDVKGAAAEPAALEAIIPNLTVIALQEELKIAKATMVALKAEAEMLRSKTRRWSCHIKGVKVNFQHTVNDLLNLCYDPFNPSNSRSCTWSCLQISHPGMIFTYEMDWVKLEQRNKRSGKLRSVNWCWIDRRHQVINTHKIVN